MPGPARVYGPALADAVRAGAVDEALVDACVRRLLGALDRVGALDDDPGAPERSEDRPEHRALAREAAADSFVLLRNDGPLPLGPGLASLAVIGPGADRAQIMGGGSAKLRAHYSVTPLQALRERLPEADVRFERGCDIDRTAPELRAGWRIEVEGSDHVSERDTGAAALRRPDRPRREPLHGAGAVHAVRVRRAHVHAAPGRALPAVRRRRGRARRRLGPAPARRVDDRPRQRGDRGPGGR